MLVGPSASDAVSASEAVLQRTIGSKASAFVLQIDPKLSGETDHFVVEAHGGKAYVSGNSAIALCRGAYDYLKGACHCMVSWSGDNVRLLDRLPDYARREVVSPAKYRHYFNVCTFGYSTVWWDWSRWQKEIDWMALHGINMPLALNGEEKIWQKVFRGYGIPDSSIQSFFSGPAFLPWQRMGNLNGHMSPLPQSWIDGQAALQKKILQSERALGMTPIVPAFSGFVPGDFGQYHPEVKLESTNGWVGFAPTHFVYVRSKMFVDIGSKFLTEYRKEFGSDHLYLADTFNEQLPLFPPSTKLEDLKKCGEAVYKSIHAADPKGVWVMQGWLFYNARNYWKEPEVESLLGSVPDGKMIVLDLADNMYEAWREHPAVRRTGWIYNTLPGFGGDTAIQGTLDIDAQRVAKAQNDPSKGRLLGEGLTMEGIDQNPVEYELMTDAMWQPDAIDASHWIDDYAKARYGRWDDSIRDAWHIFLVELYTDPKSSYEATWRFRPKNQDPVMPGFNPEHLVQAIQLLLKDGDHLKTNSLYSRDLVDFTKTWLGALADRELTAERKSGTDNHAVFQGMLHDIDRLVACRPEYRLSSWISDAREWGVTSSEKDAMEANARMQITVWGGKDLFDYANKEWAGLIDDFIANRWRQAFAGKMAELPDWELAWDHSTAPPQESPSGDAVSITRELIAKYTSLPAH